MEEIEEMEKTLSSIPSTLKRQHPPRFNGTSYLSPYYDESYHWKKKLLNANLCSRKGHVKDHEFFLNPLMTQPSKLCHSVGYQALIGNYRRTKISYVLFTKTSWLVWDCWIHSSLRIMHDLLGKLSSAEIIIFTWCWKFVSLGLKG